MTGMTLSTDGLDARRKRLLFRSWHRGTREMDLLFGRYVESVLAQAEDGALDELERLIDVPDRELFAWITGTAETPENYAGPQLAALKAFHGAA